MRSAKTILFVALALLIGWSIAPSASAGVLSNVAFEKLTDGTVNGTYPTYLPTNAVDGHGETYTYGTNDTNNWWRVDLNQGFDLAAVKITCRAGYASRTNGATMRVFDEYNVQIGTDLVLSGFVATGTNNYETRTFDNDGAGWSGARFIQVGGDGLGVAYMHLAEVQAMVDLPTYTGFIPGVAVTANNFYATHPATHGPEFLTNNSSMSDQVGPVVGDPAATCKEINAGLWHTTIDPTPGEPAVTFDLGGTYTLSRMLLWNYNVPNLPFRGLKEVLIETSQDGATFVPLDDRNGEVELGNYTIAMSPGGYAPYQGDVDLTGIQASHVRITAWSNYAADTTGHWYYGLSEVRFYGSGSPTPKAGDANRDGKVDDQDASILAANWLRTGDATWGLGDFNGDKNVDDLDASILDANWLPAAGAAVPEPSCLVLALGLLGAAAGLALRRRRGGRA